MTKTELINAISKRVKIPRSRTTDIVNAVFDDVKESLLKNERIELRGFGSFTTRHYSPKIGRNPSTGQNVVIQAKRSVSFKPGKELRDRVDHP